MKFKTYKILIIFILYCSNSFAEENLYEKGVKAFRKQNFQKAEIYFLKAGEKYPEDADILLMLGLSLTSLNKYSEAHDILYKAHKISPEYDDINMAIINLYNRQLNFEAAINYFKCNVKTYKYNAENRLIEANLHLKNNNKYQAIYLLKTASIIYPENKEIKELFNKLLKEAYEEKKKNQYWIVSTNYEHSNLTRNPQPSWEYSNINIYRKQSDKLGIHANMELQHRKERNTDKYYEIGLDYKFSKNYTGYIYSGTSAEKLISPRYRFKTGAYANVFHDRKYLKLMPLTFDLQHDIYPDTDTTILKLGIEYYVNDDLIVIPQFINIIDERGKYIKGWSLRSRLQTPFKNMILNTGIASAPETDSGIVVNTDSWFIGTNYKIKDNLTVSAYYTREAREDSYIRNIISLGVSIKF